MSQMKPLPAQAMSRGFSLIELMVALVLGLMIMAGLIQLFGSTKVTYNVTEGLARVQENARFAMEIVNRDIRMAGSQPLCSGAELDIKSWVDPSDMSEVTAFLAAGVSVMGWEYSGTSTGTVSFPPTGDSAGNPSNWSDGSNSLPEGLEGRVLPGTDVLGLRVTDLTDPEITGCSNNNAKQANIGTCTRSSGGTKSTSHGVPQGSLFMAVDCASGAGDICRLTNKGKAANLNCSNGGGNSKTGSDVWNPVYQSEMELYLPRITYFYIGESAAGEGRPGLFRAINCADGATDGCFHEEVAEGIENIQVFYRVADDSTLYTGSSIPGNDWASVRAVSLNFVATSPEEVDSRSVQQVFALDNGLNIQTEDRRLRQVYSNSVAIRNMIEVR